MTKEGHEYVWNIWIESIYRYIISKFSISHKEKNKMSEPMIEEMKNCSVFLQFASLNMEKKLLSDEWPVSVFVQLTSLNLQLFRHKELTWTARKMTDYVKLGFSPTHCWIKSQKRLMSKDLPQCVSCNLLKKFVLEWKSQSLVYHLL